MPKPQSALPSLSPLTYRRLPPDPELRPEEPPELEPLLEPPRDEPPEVAPEPDPLDPELPPLEPELPELDPLAPLDPDAPLLLEPELLVPELPEFPPELPELPLEAELPELLLLPVLSLLPPRVSLAVPWVVVAPGTLGRPSPRILSGRFTITRSASQRSPARRISTCTLRPTAASCSVPPLKRT